ncbi:arsenosugar biosynthesis radical SAM (seleno)protein ArsS [Desulfonatronospira sp.]|uniref:arsenosugar biosynthesis radical SAM (seleno)protein ArsS n=1 Tax=Desulfonatronospira sp. TaxID=1962951 RepID=UPI0025BA6A5D|nr:arsenosugar biosynthesis radical SAM (seleno)protein ArsS [Desulfonatronospira sp.]
MKNICFSQNHYGHFDIQLLTLKVVMNTPDSTNQQIPSRNHKPISQILARHGLNLTREKTTCLQINTGLVCNQSCAHCHLEAGPYRLESMDLITAEQVIEYAARNSFETIDITGGAPELNPNISTLIAELGKYTQKLMFRSNLSALNNRQNDQLMELLRDNRAVIVASLPSLNQGQTDSQRGNQVFARSIEALQRLNSLGYGKDGCELVLDLVSNPTGAFFPPSQEQAEKKFRQTLHRKWGITFNNLYCFANVPLGRFRKWLKSSGNLDPYLERLASAFNPCAARGVMCKSLICVSWDGYLYDCDFNLAAGLPMNRRKTHITDMQRKPLAGTPIALADHCYTCMAGTGFT